MDRRGVEDLFDTCPSSGILPRSIHRQAPISHPSNSEIPTTSRRKCLDSRSRRVERSLNMELNANNGMRTIFSDQEDPVVLICCSGVDCTPETIM